MDEPDRSIDKLQLLRPLERGQVLHDWNATGVNLPFETCLHRLFEEQVVRTPDAIAVTMPDVAGDDGRRAGNVTYAELNRRANRLANRLRTLGAGPDLMVAVIADRSLELVVALLGILKSGAAYLPIDPATPPARMSVPV